VKKQWNLLVVDDEPVMRESMAAWLMEDGYAVDTAASGKEAIALAASTDYALYFVDLKMPPGIDGIETMAELRKIHPDASIVIITAYATVDTAISAVREGAYEYIVKPCNPQEISLLVERSLRVKNLQRENLYLRKKLARSYSFHDIVSKNTKMLALFSLIGDVASLRSTVLVEGESGTGKELVARAIHEAGERACGPFVAVSCAALTETLLESELFGHERGAFTGASTQRKGKFELADGGTLFLDEIGDISSKLQGDLLRVLQERRFFRVGGSQEVKVDVRVIAATHRNLKDAVQQGSFRSDLYYRLNVITMAIPPLRDRLEDVPLLASHFIERLAVELGKEGLDLSESAVRVLVNHDWPGNVRELENAIERAIVTCHAKTLSSEDFSFLGRPSGAPATCTIPSGMTLDQLEELAVSATLQRTGWNVKEAAGILGIDRSTLYDKIKKHGLSRSGACATQTDELQGPASDPPKPRK
jgi:DNA-binding NtrC family response regulator